MRDEFKWIRDEVTKKPLQRAGRLFSEYRGDPSTGGLGFKLLRQQESGLCVLWVSLSNNAEDPPAPELLSLCSWPCALISPRKGTHTKRVPCYYYLYGHCTYAALFITSRASMSLMHRKKLIPAVGFRKLIDIWVNVSSEFNCIYFLVS